MTHVERRSGSGKLKLLGNFHTYISYSLSNILTNRVGSSLPARVSEEAFQGLMVRSCHSEPVIVCDVKS